MLDKRILLLGGGGHCRSVLDSVISMGCYEKIGIIDNDASASALGIDVIGTDDDLEALFRDGWKEAFITVGSIGSTSVRRRLYRLVKDIGFAVPAIADPSAGIAGGVSLGEGVFVGKHAVVNTGSTVGCCAILNTASVIEHDCVIGDFAHISPGTVLCGQVSVGADTHVGAGTVVRQGITIGSRTLVGIGSAVVKNIPEDSKAYGNPCRVVK